MTVAGFGTDVGRCLSGRLSQHRERKYLLIVAIEAAIDLCNHIVARRARRAPQDYADCFSILADLQAVDSDPVDRLKNMARFRNLIVHPYCHVDDRLLMPKHTIEPDAVLTMSGI
ncbi:MAG: DUF86 domain-containing protein [Ardenticatenia bacterium]|nr:DUF86 domain-containing protein [Ardenticatenia bacterium]